MFLGRGLRSPGRDFSRLRASASNRDQLCEAISDMVERDPGAITRAMTDGHLGDRLWRIRTLIRCEVLTLRAQGTAPERMLVEMKKVLVPMVTIGQLRRDGCGAADALMSQMVRWCVEAYYSCSI